MCNRLILPDFASFIQEKQIHSLTIFSIFRAWCVFLLLCEDLYLGAKHHHDIHKLKQKRVWCYDSFCGSLKQFYILEEEEIFSCFSCVVLFVPNISSTAAFALCTPCDHKKTNKQYSVLYWRKIFTPARFGVTKRAYILYFYYFFREIAWARAASVFRGWMAFKHVLLQFADEVVVVHFLSRRRRKKNSWNQNNEF